MSESNPSPWRGRVIMIAVVLLFAVPPIIAWFMLTEGWHPGASVNHGELIQPPVQIGTTGWQDPLPAEYFAGRWTLVHAVAGPCRDACAALMDKTARVRVALGKDAARVQRLLLVPEQVPSVEAARHHGARVIRAGTPAVYALLRDGERIGLSVVDPRGFRMMRYSLPLEATGLLEDLERLLRLSNEDVERFLRDEGEAAS